jgi:hypothetical protein
LNLGNYGLCSALDNYPITSASHGHQTPYTGASSMYFLGNLRKGNNAVDARAVEYQPGQLLSSK